jgi:hypothetical protein
MNSPKIIPEMLEKTLALLNCNRSSSPGNQKNNGDEFFNFARGFGHITG